MNPFMKVFCRVYQWAFHIALPVLPYREPEIMHCTDEVPATLNKIGKRSALLITDSFLHKSGITARLEEGIKKAE